MIEKFLLSGGRERGERERGENSSLQRVWERNYKGERDDVCVCEGDEKVL